MKTPTKLLAGALIAAVVGFGSIPLRAGVEPIAVIVHPSNPVSSLSLLDLSLISKSIKKEWAGGAPVVAFQLPPDNPLRQEYERTVLGLIPEEASAYWRNRRLRDEGSPPTVLRDTSLMLMMVAAQRYALGYVKASEVNAKVKVVATITDGKVTRP